MASYPELMNRRSFFQMIRGLVGMAPAVPLMATGADMPGMRPAQKKGSQQQLPILPDLRDAAAEDLRFYHGDQWDAEVLKSRAARDRPSLVVNRLPAILMAALQQSRRIPEETTPAERERLALAVVRLNRDVQRMYNYFVSARCEILLTDRRLPSDMEREMLATIDDQLRVTNNLFQVPSVLLA